MQLKRKPAEAAELSHSLHAQTSLSFPFPTSEQVCSFSHRPFTPFLPASDPAGSQAEQTGHGKGQEPEKCPWHHAQGWAQMAHVHPPQPLPSR